MSRCPAILILAFNRPGAAAQLARALSAVKPPRVYVALDGPRADAPDDVERCEQVREILSSLPWEHELHALIRESNLGCGPAVASGIDWFFEHEREGVILEDDVLAHPSMFPFMGELLERYRDEQRVMHISGSNYAGVRPQASYFFSRYVCIWGWATWRRAWRHFKPDISDWRRAPSVLRAPGLDWRTRRYLAFAFGRAGAGLGNWDYQWKYAVMRNGLAITPSVNLSVTTGFGPEATGLRQQARVPALCQIPETLVHPPSVAVDPELDHALFAEQLARGRWYWEASRLILPSPRLYHLTGRLARATAVAARRAARGGGVPGGC